MYKSNNLALNTSKAVNKWKSIDHLFDLFLVLIVWVL